MPPTPFIAPSPKRAKARIGCRAQAGRSAAPLRVLEKTNPFDIVQPVRKADEDTSPRRRKPILCAQCGRPVTYEDLATRIDGAHAHVRANPHGNVFRVGCFEDAPGCSMLGEASAEHSWFAGFEWRIALCASCRTHLGWRFEGGGQQRFFGLILTQLTRPH